tara:strand:- start:4434 stop:7736 length:3303 start_codon:yes stop_codon:yes gene_type:complete
MQKIKYYIVLLAIFTSCKKSENVLFTSLSSKTTHIDFQNRLTSKPDLNILNYLYFYNGSGVSVGDFNNDGLSDLYFTANQTPDKLYINKGDFKFEDATLISCIDNTSNWTTGSTVVDINNDGLLDIYICRLGNYSGIESHNLLYVNQGLKNGVPFFKESASDYGLDIKSFATQSIFFDYDQDSDLDMFLLNHSIHPNSNYGKGKLRMQADTLAGDRLYENVEGKFVDVSINAGIFQGKIGYGLGVSISDINNDGYPDIYVGNDFFENDYLYINQKDKSFKDIISSNKTQLGHTSHFSMGNSISDINNDGYTDIISLDMLPENLKTYKTSGLEYPYQMYEFYLKNGYSPQFMQNTLHINNGNGSFSETAHLSGMAATEWSWSPIVCDLDNDSNKDIYITNGILGATNDMDFINFISNENIQKQLGKNMSDKDLALANEIPPKKVKNYIYRNNGDNTFENNTELWANQKESYSNGGVYADLDNDGNLDLVINNINEPAYILKNNSEKFTPNNNYLKVKFGGPDKNKFGIGAKVKVYIGSKILTEENYTTKGYLSSVEPKLNFGLGEISVIDSLEVIWSNGEYQTLKDISVNKEIEVDFINASGNYFKNKQLNSSSSFLVNSEPLINFKHNDPISIEFNRDPLIPYASTNLGPQTSVGDINNDGLDDIFICGAKAQSSRLFVQKENAQFESLNEELFNQDAINEDVSSTFFDANLDGLIDILVVSGGNEFKYGKALSPRLYINNGDEFVKDSIQFKNIEINASKVTTVDIDNDGDLDVSITSNLIPWQFGKTPKQYIFKNDGKGSFTNVSETYAKELQDIGNVQDIIWVDINNDLFADAIVCGYWMPISILLNNGKKLTLQKNNKLQETNGWWNTIKIADFDNDGDLDLVAGNWGLNTRLKASKEQPITLYSNDFDDNGNIDPIITYYYEGQETPFSSKDELVKQLPFLNKKFLSYKDFADASFSELLPHKKINEAYKKQVFELTSCYYENLGDNTFKKHILPLMTQVSSVNSIAVDDFNNDGYLDLFLTGNNYDISTQLGKLDASHGAILLNNKEGFFMLQKNQTFDVSGPARDIQKIKVSNEIYYIISINNNTPIFLKKNK